MRDCDRIFRLINCLRLLPKEFARQKRTSIPVDTEYLSKLTGCKIDEDTCCNLNLEIVNGVVYSNSVFEDGPINIGYVKGTGRINSKEEK